MTEHDEDRAELIESKKALAAAKRSTAATETVAASIHRSSAEIRSAIQPNGYVARFRELLRGA